MAQVQQTITFIRGKKELMEKLPIEFKEKWVAALRSGEYKQGRMGLYSESENSFCCLGIGCIISGLEKNKLIGKPYVSGRLAGGLVPTAIVGYGSQNSLVRTLAEMNDLHNKSFSEIADYIEENL